MVGAFHDTVTKHTSQVERAEIVGLTGGAQLCRREARMATGEADTYLEVYLAHHFLRLARAVPALREAVVEFVTGAETPVTTEPVERDLSAFAEHAAHELGAIVAALSDQKISRIEAAQRDTALMQLQEQIHQVRIKLGKVARGGRS